MRIAVVSDIHGNLPALQAVCAEIASAGADLVLNLGDIASGPLWPAETVDRLIALGWPTIAGNHERQLLTQPPERQGPSDAFAAARLDAAQRAWLAALPTHWKSEPTAKDLAEPMAETMAERAPARRPADSIACVHGAPEDDLQYLLETVTPDLGEHGSRGIRAATEAEVASRLAPWSADGRPPPALLLCGHSHRPRLLQCGTTLVVNPGSVGLPAYDDDHPHPHRVENHAPHARWALLERGAAGWSVRLCATAYDHEAAARRAEAGGRGDWADALRSGRVGRLEREVTG